MTYTLITGASRGIGEAMAEHCAAKGFNLILVARSEEKLVEITRSLSQRYKIDTHFFIGDLIEEGIIEKLYDFCHVNDLWVDKLINNAGIGAYGRFESLPLTDQYNLLRINQEAMLKMTHTFITMLKKQAKAYLMNVASTACYQPIPYMSVYAASQSFIQSFTLAIREELRRSGVNVSCLCPGPTATDFFERAGLHSLPVNSSEIKMSPDEVAEVAIEGMLNNKAEIIPGASNTIGAYLSKLFPNKWIIRTVTSLFAPKVV